MLRIKLNDILIFSSVQHVAHVFCFLYRRVFFSLLIAFSCIRCVKLLLMQIKAFLMLLFHVESFPLANLQKAFIM